VYRARSINLDTYMNRQEKVFKPPKEKLHWCPPKFVFLRLILMVPFSVSAKVELGASLLGI
jgi:hypothetical protein